jgi:TolB-like protein
MPGAREDIPDALLDVELERLAASGAFRRSPMQLRLLRYLVERERAGEGTRLKESTIAIDVLGASAGQLDGNDDASVRVAVHRLRERLARYYADEGAWAAVEIELPVGAYRPRMLRRAQAAGPKLPSIAVLPLRNFAGDVGLDAFCDGLSEEITDALAQVPGVKVVSRTSAFRFRGATDVRAAGQALAVATLLEGSVQAHDGVLRAVVQWVRAADGYHVWSYRIDAALDEDMQAFKARVALEVVRGLQQRLLEGGAPGRLAPLALPRRSRVPEAQALYEDARYLIRMQSGDGYGRAIERLRRSVAADPTFAAALSALACGLLNLVGLTIAPAAQLLGEARGLLEQAVQLDPQLGEAHAALGFIACAFDRDWARAERAHLRGIRCAPSLCYAHSTYAWGLMVNGRFAEADAEYRFARELDPLDLKMRAHHALLALYSGDDARAERELDAILALEPRYLIAQALRATACLWRGDLARAEAAFATLARDYPTLTIGEVGLAQVDAESGRVDSARARLRAVTAQERGAPLPPYQAAMIHARLRERDDALAWLDRAAREHDMNFVCAPLDRTFVLLRDDAGFVDLLRRHGLAPVWRRPA